MRIDGLEVVENEITRIAQSLGVFKHTPIKYIHIKQCKMRVNYRDWMYEAGFTFQDNYYPKTAAEKAKIAQAIQQTIKNYMDKYNCIYKGQTLYTQDLNICPNFPCYEAVVLFNMKNREEYAGCSPKMKSILRKFHYKPQADIWGFFEEEGYGLAIKPKKGKVYEIRNNTEYRCKYLPGAHTGATEEDTIKAMIVMNGCRKAKHELTDSEVDVLFTAQVTHK